MPDLNAHTAGLTTYLNDHLAGSVLALELLEHLAASAQSPDRETAIRYLHEEIKHDQEILKSLLNHSGSQESTIKKAGAWMMEKLAHLKLRLAGGNDDALGTLEALEMVSLGIEGKKGLWRSLQQISGVLPPSLALDFEQLMATASSQRDRVETWRMEASIQALTPAAE